MYECTPTNVSAQASTHMHAYNNITNLPSFACHKRLEVVNVDHC